VIRVVLAHDVVGTGIVLSEFHDPRVEDQQRGLFGQRSAELLTVHGGHDHDVLCDHGEGTCPRGS